MCTLLGSDLVCAGEVPVPYMADGAGGELGDLRAILCLHGAVPRTRVQECHRKHWLYSFISFIPVVFNDFCSGFGVYLDLI